MGTQKWRWAGLAVGLALVGLLAVGLYAATAQAQPPPGDPVKGKAVYAKSCALCHGANGEGVVGPPLAGLAGHMERLAQIPGFSMEEGLKTIRNGIPNRMPAFPPSILSDEDLGNIVAYLLTTPPTTGQNLYENPSSCAACHGKRGIGGVGPPLDARKAAAALGLTKEQLLPGLIPLVRNGIPGKMPAFPVLTDGEIVSIGEYLWDLPRLSWEEEFTLRHGRAPTGEDIADRDWGNRFMFQNGREPTEAEWAKHYNERKGLGYR
ncbi:MAG: c-type cytochrome [Dehalococcoidia bacterium]|nr:c-type cytochrome [Dehalococcoidia bacterium]